MDGNDAIVSYQFFTAPNDIKFGILFKSSLEDNNGNVCCIVDVCGVDNSFLNISEFVMLKGIERVQSHLKVIIGYISFPSAGTIILQWDNTFSLMRSKELNYLVEVIEMTQYTYFHNT